MLKAQYGRKDRLIKEKRHDAYQETIKLPEPTKCVKCHAIFSNGRWTWKNIPTTVNETTCPACRRIEDNYPAGFVKIRGKFLREHRDNIHGLIQNIENQEKRDRPLERIISINKTKNQTVVTTTGIHVARRIGEALSRSFKGDLSFQYADGEKSIRVDWRREE